ncbi:MAG TPA: DUF3574 domain-containing protein [Planctomycetota bacterium]|jgi:hypothetical protein|nr:DUF3574 domain-containing protein [Planctomycetota bacterium]
MRTLTVMLILLACLLALGCASPRAAETGAWQRSELYFGLSRRGAPEVTAEDWRAFVVSEVVPAFPGGFTELTAQGFFSEDGKSQHEPVRILVILNPPEQIATTNQKLDAIGRSYCNRFNQDAVLRTDSEARLTFLRGQ